MVTVGKNLVICDGSDMLQHRLAKLNQMRKNRHFCDVVLQVGSAEIHAHRSVLACASPYFYELFTADDNRKTCTEEKIVYKLSTSFEYESLEKLIQFAYTGELDAPPPLVRHIYVGANKLKMERVAHSCGEYLINTITPETCLSVRTIPGIANDPELVERLDSYIQNQIDLTALSKEWAGICRIQLRVIICNADEASITSFALSLLALEYIRKQIEVEGTTIDDLKEKKHLLYLNIDNSLHDCVDIRPGDAQDTEMVQDYKKVCRKLSKTSLKQQQQQSKKVLAGLHPAKPRMMLYSRSISDEEEPQDAEWKLIAHAEVGERSFVAIVTLKSTVCVLSVMQVENPPSPTLHTPHQSRPASVEKADNYTVIPHMSSQKCATGVGSYQGQLLVCGGYDRGECLKEVELYSPRDNTWTMLPDMRQARGRFDLTVLEGFAFAVGGCDGSRELDSVEVLNFETKKWSYVASLPLARSNTGVCNTRGKVYCIGGWNGYAGIKQCDAYDPHTDQWLTIAPLHTGRYQAGVAAIDGRVYAVGGCDSWNCLNSVEVLDVDENTWHTVAPISTPRRGCGLAVFKGKLFMMGGSDGQQSLCSTEIYDPETNIWTPGPSMTTCRANVSCAVLDGRLYAVGGFSGKNFLNSIEYLDPDTMEWTNFTLKPEGYKSRKPSRSFSYSNGQTGLDEESRSSETQEDCSTSELDTSIPEELENCGGVNGKIINGLIGLNETASSVH